ncbi:MAG: Holliday junction resolvase RuvX [Firmicutes bacterium]|nr:Holliday junction resolvase RuvX [Bacillota bacterium]
MRLLGLDYGSKTVGVAMTDPTLFLASPVETIKREDEVNLKQTVRRIRAICEENDIHLIVLGLPLTMDGKIGKSAEKALAFQHRLERDLYLVRVIMEDERLTTWEATQPLLEAGIRRKSKRKEVVDQLAARLILQQYIDNHSREEIEQEVEKAFHKKELRNELS